jgi:prepilin-type N-terminal cleavage/methylation domain-containing protein
MGSPAAKVRLPTSRPGPSSDPRRPRDADVKRGFTLIELAITLMLLALGSALVAPAVGRSLDGIRGRAEVSGFTRYLRAAREQAVTRGEAQEVRLEDDGRTLVITAQGSAAVRSSRQFSYLLEIQPDPPTARTVTFEPQGVSSGGTFYLLAPGNRRYVVTIDPVTGRVTTRYTAS